MLKSSIFYFSGTGNTAFAAGVIADAFKKKQMEVHVYSIEHLTAMPDISDSDYIGFGYPVYSFETPEIMLDFLNAFPVARKGQKAFVFTTMAGLQFYAIKKPVDILKNKQYSIVCSRGFRMPSNLAQWKIIPPYSEGRIKDIFSKASADIEQTVNLILGDNVEVDLQLSLPGFLITRVMGGLFVKFGSHDYALKNFSISDKCTGCGLCEKTCPRKNIRMENRKPVFGDHCLFCNRCYNICPEWAIICKKNPLNERRYLAPGFKPEKIKEKAFFIP